MFISSFQDILQIIIKLTNTYQLQAVLLFIITKLKIWDYILLLLVSEQQTIFITEKFYSCKLNSNDSCISIIHSFSGQYLVQQTHIKYSKTSIIHTSIIHGAWTSIFGNL